MFLTLLSFTLFAVPIFVTFGGYFAAEYKTILSCGFNCGVPGGTGSISPGTPGFFNPIDVLYCQLNFGITPSPGDYTYNPNQWGNPDGNEGSLCIKFDTGTPPSGYGQGWSVTWDFTTPGPETKPVHAFPNSGVHIPSPVQLSSLVGLSLDIQWSYAMGSTPSLTTNYQQLTAGDVNANVAVDMFMAHDKGNAASTTDSDYEVMIWFAGIGPAAQPLGFEDGSKDTRVVNGTTFDLYAGNNQFGQETFTWLVSTPTNTFVGNVGPLLHDLATYSGPSPDDYLGYMAFGTEAFWASQNATFYNPRLDMNIITA